jgi:hypothetical protein
MDGMERFDRCFNDLSTLMHQVDATRRREVAPYLMQQFTRVIGPWGIVGPAPVAEPPGIRAMFNPGGYVYWVTGAGEPEPDIVVLRAGSRANSDRTSQISCPHCHTRLTITLSTQ